MRLAQIARKVQVKPAEIRKFIQDEFNVELDADPNIKLEDNHVEAIKEKFKVPEEASSAPKKEEATEEKEEVTDVVEEIDPTVETDIKTLKEIAEEEAPDKVEIPDVSSKKEEKSEDEAEEEEKQESETTEEAKKVVEIKYDEEGEEIKKQEQEEESINYEEAEVDREAEIIAAKVDKLEGLKVVGKIDLGSDETEEEDLPTADAIEDEIDAMDGEVDTSGFPDLTEEKTDDEKEAIFAELDAQMDNQPDQEVKTVTNESSAVKENLETEQEQEEYSIYKNDRGEYRFTTEQWKNREKSLALKKERERIKAMKKKKKRHYEENVAAKVKPPKKKKKNKPSSKAQKRKEQQEEPKGLWQKFLNWLND